jgi:site-specific DNA-methyltransferase (adenine-specific)
LLELNKIYCIDNIEGMVLLDDNSVDLTITSPPYDDMDENFNPIPKNGLRKYNGYLWNFKEIVYQLYRITKDGGVIVWVVNDPVIKGSESLASSLQKIYFKKVGFNIHDTMIYEKNGSSFPSPRNGSRYTQIFEYKFIFSKGIPKVHNLIADKKNRWAGYSNFGSASHYNKNGDKIITGKHKVTPEFSVRNNIWRYNTGKGYSTKDEINHPAIFPEELARDHIFTWSNEGDLVFDPFMGSGTVAKMAKLNNRQYIGFEISEEYCNMANKRLNKI